MRREVSLKIMVEVRKTAARTTAAAALFERFRRRIEWLDILDSLVKKS
jgi:hypothetical protein